MGYTVLQDSGLLKDIMSHISVKRLEADLSAFEEEKLRSLQDRTDQLIFLCCVYSITSRICL